MMTLSPRIARWFTMFLAICNGALGVGVVLLFLGQSLGVAIGLGSLGVMSITFTAILLYAFVQDPARIGERASARGRVALAGTISMVVGCGALMLGGAIAALEGVTVMTMADVPIRVGFGAVGLGFLLWGIAPPASVVAWFDDRGDTPIAAMQVVWWATRVASALIGLYLGAMALRGR